MTPRRALIVAVALLTGVGCVAERAGEEDDPIDERFYSGAKADHLGLESDEERALLLLVNEATKEELDAIESCSIRAASSIAEWREKHGTIRSLYEFDTVPYIGRSTFDALVDHVREEKLATDLEFFASIQPEMMSTVTTSQAVVFGGPTGSSRWLRSLRIEANRGDRVAFRLVPIDATSVNTRIDLTPLEGETLVENPYSLKEARLPGDDRPWHDGILLEEESYVIALQNRGAPGNYLFEMRCVGGPCLDDATQTTPNDHLFRSELRGADERVLSSFGGAMLPAEVAGHEDAALLSALRELHAKRHRPMTYDQARNLLFALLHNEDGSVEGVYSGEQVETDGIPNWWQMNTEHAWPRSRGVSGAFVSDLHHLFPTVSWVNSARAEHNYCELDREVGGHLQASWGYAGKDDYCFEPRDDFKGNAARALFYVSAAYGLSMDDEEEETLRDWHTDDPVDQAERDRNDAVARLQGTRNHFIDAPLLVERIDDF